MVVYFILIINAMEVPRRSHTIPKILPQERRSLLLNLWDISAPRLAEERIHRVFKTYKSAETKSSGRMLNTPKIIKATCILSNASSMHANCKPYISTPEYSRKGHLQRNVRGNILLDSPNLKQS